MTKFWTAVAGEKVSTPTGLRAGRLGSLCFRTAAGHLTMGWLMRPTTPHQPMYHIADRLHSGRVADVPGPEIAETVSAWLAELGAESPFVDDLARAAQAGDWPAAYAIAQYLSVEVTLAAVA